MRNPFFVVQYTDQSGEYDLRRLAAVQAKDKTQALERFKATYAKELDARLIRNPVVTA